MAIFRYKTIIGRRLHARNLPNQRTEAKIGCNALNRMTALGMPASAGIPMIRGPREEDAIGRFLHAPTRRLNDFQLLWR